MDFRGKDIICGIQYTSLEDVMTEKVIEIGANWAVICSFEKKTQPFVVFLGKLCSDLARRWISGGKISFLAFDMLVWKML